MFDHNGLHCAWLIGRILKVTHREAALAAKSDVYDCIVYYYVLILTAFQFSRLLTSHKAGRREAAAITNGCCR